MCELNVFLNITRHTVLSLNEVVTQKTLDFVVQINGVSITFAYKLTVEQFITQIMHRDLRYFFTLNSLQFSYSPSQLTILFKYKFFQLERLFHFSGSFSKYKFVIFRHSLVWNINRIIYLVETGKLSVETHLRCYVLVWQLLLPLLLWITPIGEAYSCMQYLLANGCCYNFPATFGRAFQSDYCKCLFLTLCVTPLRPGS